MTNVFKAIRKYLLTSSAATDPVIALLSGGIWSIQVPKENRSYPAISLQLIARTPYQNLDGVPSLYRSLLRVKVWDAQDKFDRGSELREKVRKALTGKRASMSSLDVQGITETGTCVDYQDPDTYCWYFTQDFYVVHGVIE